MILAIMSVMMQWSAAQLSITTNMRQDALWDNASESWEVLATDENPTTLLFDKELTSFKHTTATITSMYTILDWDYNEEEVKYTMKVKSDANNEYEMIIDGINNCVAFFYWKDNNYILVRHTIQDSHFEE